MAPDDVATAEVAVEEPFPTLDEVKAQYKRAIQQMLRATDPALLSGLMQEVQRLRIVALLVEEVEKQAPSDKVYRELVLMTRMTAKPGTGPAPAPPDEDETTPEEREAGLGVLNPRQASDLLKVLERVSTPGPQKSEIPDDYEPE